MGGEEEIRKKENQAVSHQCTYMGSKEMDKNIIMESKTRPDIYDNESHHYHQH